MFYFIQIKRKMVGCIAQNKIFNKGIKGPFINFFKE
tara:strand:+ start:218 stop:325 length:108 start_codon:yes stop_codon:yes gene_type:complete